jgi:hypothetical protein
MILAFDEIRNSAFELYHFRPPVVKIGAERFYFRKRNLVTGIK